MRWALVCSIILHLIAVAAIYLAPRDDQSPLSYVEVSLNNLAPTDAPQPIPTNNTAPTEQHKPSKADETEAESKPEPKPEPKPVSNAAGTAPAFPAPSAVASAAPNADYLAQVRQKIAKSQHYPRAAKARRQQGTVTVFFSIASSGHVQALSIISSSGHSSLDQAALKAVEKASPFAPPASTVSDIMLPIEFRLN